MRTYRVGNGQLEGRSVWAQRQRCIIVIILGLTLLHSASNGIHDLGDEILLEICHDFLILHDHPIFTVFGLEVALEFRNLVHQDRDIFDLIHFYYFFLTGLLGTGEVELNGRCL